MDDNENAGRKTPYYRGLSFWCQVIVLLFFTVASLVLASSVLIPLSIAMLLFVLLSATSDRIARIKVFGWQVPRILAHLASISIIFLGVVGILSILSNQAGEVSKDLPQFEERLSSILSRIVAVVGDQNYAEAQKALKQLNLAGFASGVLGSAGAFLSALFLVLIYVPFMLVERMPMKAKIKLAIQDPVMAEKVRNIIESTSTSIQRYVGIKTLACTLTGIGSYIVMWSVDLDFAETWAVLAFILNFVPTVGSIIGVALPSLVALVQFDTFSTVFVVLIGCGAVQLTVGNILEPMLLGRRLNLSPLMVILALTFWTAIWGIPGALMSVPITVCIMIILTHIPSTRPIAILMSGDGRVGMDDLHEPPSSA